MLLVVDGSYLCHAAKHSRTGELRNGILFGALRMVIAEIKEFDPDRVVICSDCGGLDTLKRKGIAGSAASRVYKENRRKPQRTGPAKIIDTDFGEVSADGGGDDNDLENQALYEDFKRQRDMFSLVCAELGFEVMHAPGYEADDVIAWVVEGAKEHSEVRILSSDSDLYQLFSEDRDVVFVSPTKKGPRRVFGYQDFKDKYQCRSDAWPMVKAIMGDSTDNVIGIEGIGAKTAVKLIRGTASLKVELAYKRQEDRVDDNLRMVVLPFDDGVAEALVTTWAGDWKSRLWTWKQTLGEKYEMPSLGDML